jgi:hypothetical protein
MEQGMEIKVSRREKRGGERERKGRGEWRQAPRRAGHERHVGRYFESLAKGQKWSKEWKSR